MARYQKMRAAALKRQRDARGLTQSQSDLLKFLADNAGKHGLEALADRIGYCVPTIHGGLVEMEARGLVKIDRFRHVWGPDGVNEYHLTETGLALVKIQSKFNRGVL